MAKVPYSAESQVSVSSASAVPNLNVRVVPDAFGVGIGEAMGKLGKQFEAVGDEIFSRAVEMQKISNDVEANKANAEFVEKLSELNANYQMTQGEDAVKGRQPYLDAVKQLREDIGSRLSNPAVKRAYDNNTRIQFSYAANGAARHAAAGFKQYQASDSKAEVKTAQRIAYTFPVQSDAFQDAVEKARLAARNNIENKGLSPAAIEEAEKDAVGLIYDARLQGLLAQDPLAAQEFFEQNRDKFLNPEKAEGQVLNRMYTLGAQTIAAKLTQRVNQDIENGRPAEGLDSLVKKAQAEAQKIRPGDELFSDRVANAVRIAYNQKKKDIEDTQHHYQNFVLTAINGGLDPNGKPITDPEQLKAYSPEAAQAWDSLSPARQNQMIAAMARISRRDMAPNPQNYAEYRKILGQLQSPDPAEREEAVKRDYSELIGRMPQAWVEKIIREADFIYRGGALNKDVTTGMTLLRGAGIIPPAVVQNKELYAEFRGALQEAVETYREERGRPPQTSDEWKQLGAELTKNYTYRQQLFGVDLWTSEKPLWQLPAPAGLKEALEKDLKREPTDIEVRNNLIREQLKKRFQQLWAKPPEPAPKPGRGSEGGSAPKGDREKRSGRE